MLRAEEEYKQIEEIMNPKSHVKYEMTEEASSKTLKIIDERDKEPDLTFENQHLSFELYKKRKLPIYLLSIDRTDYPIFCSRDDLSMALLVKPTENDENGDQISSNIIANVNLENYADQIEKINEKNTKSTTAKRKMKQIMNEYIFEVKLPLISTANEAIKKIITAACFKYQIDKIQKASHLRYFAMKVHKIDPAHSSQRILLRGYAPAQLFPCPRFGSIRGHTRYHSSGDPRERLRLPQIS